MRHKRFKRITELGKNGFPVLKNRLHSEKALALLYEYENTGLTPKEVRDLQETVNNLRCRIKEFDEW